MPSAVGLQFSLELAKVFPVGEAVQHVGKSVLSWARDLRKSNSDLVVESDLAELLGRLKIQPEFERNFKQHVKAQDSIEIPGVQKVCLAQGAGPTVVNGFERRQYMSAIIQLSLLCSKHQRGTLANMLSETMDERNTQGVPNASESPGFDGIINTLDAISSQTVDFNWATISEVVEAKVASKIPNFRYNADHHWIPPGLMLGLADALYAVQSLPEDRKLVISDECGIVTLVIWAHFLLGLTVVVESHSFTHLRFGSDASPQVIINWQGRQGVRDTLGFGVELGMRDDTHKLESRLRVLDADGEVILSSSGIKNVGEETIYAQDRHAMRGWGTACLRRALNASFFTPESDEIYPAIAKLGTALAIYQSHETYRRTFQTPEVQLEAADSEQKSIAGGLRLQLELWRFLQVSHTMFEGIEISSSSVQSHLDFLSEKSPFDATIMCRSKDDFPASFRRFIKRAQENEQPNEFHYDAICEKLEDLLNRLANVIAILSHVANVSECSEMPLRMLDRRTSIPFQKFNGGIYGEEVSQGKRCNWVNKREIFNAIAELISDDCDDLKENAYRAAWLWSDFGWSLYYSSVGDQDPSMIRPELCYMKKGVPTYLPGGERKKLLRDDRPYTDHRNKRISPVIRAGSYLTEQTSKVARRREFWSKRPRAFELTVVIDLKAIAYEGVDKISRKHLASFQEDDAERLAASEYYDTAGYEAMHDWRWEALITPPRICQHGYSANKTSSLGPDAVAVAAIDGLSLHEAAEEKIVVLLTSGDRRLRWLALKSYTGAPLYDQRRSVMLRGLDCCANCALEYVSSLPGLWFLAL